MVAVCGPAEFAGTEKLTVPLPVPEDPEVIESSASALDVAVHAQCASFVVTSNEPMLALFGKLPEFVLNVKKQLGAACVRVNTAPLTIMVPVRGPPWFAATE
jgi:hypothetical protein